MPHGATSNPSRQILTIPAPAARAGEKKLRRLIARSPEWRNAASSRCESPQNDAGTKQGYSDVLGKPWIIV